jgi:D-serine deaminase-like pyridoxal phosphate-dependent protein
MSRDPHRDALAARLDQAVAEASPPPGLPVVVVDLDAFDANADDLVRRAAGKPVRVASKSVRVPALLRRALDHDGFRGVLAFTLAEALWLHGEGVAGDILMAYPTVDRAALAGLTGSP